VKIARATARYEEWLARRLRLIESDLAIKHQQMRSAPFPFLRATFYRWAQTWQDICKDEARAPLVLAVGDLHVENFGTWRDIEGRLIWGINDFDEAWPLPYTNDLVRLAASALLSSITCDAKQGIDAILAGYREALTGGGRPFALAEHHTALRLMAVHRLHEPEKFWARLHALPYLHDRPDDAAIKAIRNLLPERAMRFRLVHRIAGLGSLGRERYLAIADWQGGCIAREAKALAPSACAWADGAKGSPPVLYREIMEHAIRTPDPFVRPQKRWIARRIAPDCSRIELSALPAKRDELRLLQSMGWETANVHLGTGKARVLLKDLEKRRKGWLYAAAREMEKAVLADFEDYSTR
jgi:hypothetical protein